MYPKVDRAGCKADAYESLMMLCIFFFADLFAMESMVTPTVMLFTAFVGWCVVRI
jgi:hypothetical protein